MAMGTPRLLAPRRPFFQFEFSDDEEVDFTPAPRPARPLLLRLPAVEALVIETLPGSVDAVRRSYQEASKVGVEDALGTGRRAPSVGWCVCAGFFRGVPMVVVTLGWPTPIVLPTARAPLSPQALSPPTVGPHSHL